uniref:Uncharacterized protein n=1 Tax=Knipowitschia caucasica TaxID=637954 RepID=A0AAV2M4Y1_KNICA
MDHYNNSLSSILDIHAPLKTRTVNFTRSAPWYTNQHRAMKRSGRVLERAYTTSGLTVHKLAYREHQKSYAKALSSARPAAPRSPTALAVITAAQQESTFIREQQHRGAGLLSTGNTTTGGGSCGGL